MGKLPGQKPSPEPGGIFEPPRRPKSPRGLAGVGTPASSNGASPLAERVARTYLAPNEGPPTLKSLYEDGRFDAASSPASQVDPHVSSLIAPEEDVPPPSLPQLSEKEESSKDRGAQAPVTAAIGEPTELNNTTSSAIVFAPVPSGFASKSAAGNIYLVSRSLNLRNLANYWRRPPGQPHRLPERRALLISNNPGSPDDPTYLQFPDADVERLKKCLIDCLGFQEKDIRVVKAKGDKSHVIAEFNWFFKQAVVGDILILFISSHVDFDERDDSASFMGFYRDDHFKALIAGLPIGCFLEIILDTCYSTKLIKLRYTIKQVLGKSPIGPARRSITMGASSPIVGSSPPPAETRSSSSGNDLRHSSNSHPEATTIPGRQLFHPTTESRSHHRSFGVSAAPALVGAEAHKKPAHAPRQSPGANLPVVGGQPMPNCVPGSKDIALWGASTGSAYEPYDLPEAPAKNGTLINAFCHALEIGKRTRQAIWDVVEPMIGRENSIRAKYDSRKTAQELADDFAVNGPRDQCPQLTSTCKDKTRVLKGEVFCPMPPGAYVA